MARAPVAGTFVDYDDVGRAAPAILAMPGWCASRRAFDPLLPLLAKRHRVLSMDWRGHGRSGAFAGDFGFAHLADDACAVIEAAGDPVFVPLATAHAGWVAIELRRRLGPQRVPAIIFVDWIVFEAPPPFLAGLKDLQDPHKWKAARDGLFHMWSEGVDNAQVLAFIKDDMSTYGASMWARAAREISSAYAREGSPLKALAALTPTVPTLHLYAQPADPAYLAAQESFARAHPWFSVRRLDAKSHIPTLEVPAQVAREALTFLGAAARG